MENLLEEDGHPKPIELHLPATEEDLQLAMQQAFKDFMLYGEVRYYIITNESK